jgi:phosphotriesterase-related protein
MIHTVLGDISEDKLGVTLMHEHISWDPDGASSTRKYETDEAVDFILPYLRDLKSCGCSTLVEGTPPGAGRDISILKRCSEESGLNIIACTGAWDGSDNPGKFVVGSVVNGSTDEIAACWSAEFTDGIGNTGVKPGFLKVALGDTGEITGLQEKLLRAAARASLRTGACIQCHTFSPISAKKAVMIIEEENLPYDRFIWIHADGARDFNTTKALAGKGIWFEYDCLARMPDHSRYVKLLKMTIDAGLTDRLLLSQDAGCYRYGEKNTESTIYPYSPIFKEFIPLCLQNEIPDELFGKLLSENPKKVLGVGKACL